MKLGRLLLKKFRSKKGGLRVRNAMTSIHVRSGGRRSPLSFLKTHRGWRIARKVKTVAVVAAVLPTAAPAEKPVAIKAENPQTGSIITTSDFVRPGDKLRQSIEAFLVDQRSEHTRRAYGKDLKRFVRFLLVRKLDRGPENLSRIVLIAYKESLLSEGLQHTTVDRHVATLRSFFRWLVEDGLLEKNPAEGVRFMNPRRLSRTVGFTDEEVKRVLAQPNLHTRTGAQHYAIMMLLFYCGLRRSEVCGLRTGNIATERGLAVLRLTGKGDAERIVVMIKPVWNALQYYFRITRRSPSTERKDTFLFSPIRNNRTGETIKPLDASMIFYIVTRYARKAGVANRVSPHSCRATAISNARDHNVPDRAIQQFAGWASPDMITRYDKRRSSVEKSAAHAINYGACDRASDMSPVVASAPQKMINSP